MPQGEFHTLDPRIDPIGGVHVESHPVITSQQEAAAIEAELAEKIEAFYQEQGGMRALGFPLNETQFHGDTAARAYSGGIISVLGNTPSQTETTWARVRYVGFHCYSESDWDEGSSADEPYFVIGVVGPNASNTVRFGPYVDVDAGEERYEASYVASEANRITPPIVIGVVAIENDYGTPAEAEGKVRHVMEELERKFDQAAGSLAGMSGDSHVMPEWARDILIGWIPEGISAVLGMGDDKIGANSDVVFDDKAGLLAYTPLPVLGMHGSNEYNRVIHVGDGGEGDYNLYFKVDLFTTTTSPQ